MAGLVQDIELDQAQDLKGGQDGNLRIEPPERPELFEFDSFLKMEAE